MERTKKTNPRGVEMKSRIEFDIKKYMRKDYELRDLCKKYLDRKITFGVLLNRLKLWRIIKIK